MPLNPRIVIRPCFVAFRLTALCGCVMIPLTGLSAGATDAPPLLLAETDATSILNPTNGVGSWIWDANTFDKQTCRFWRAFEIPHSTVASARLRITVDNGYRLFLDGREVGRGSDWHTLTEYDVTWVLNPGRHVL